MEERQGEIVLVLNWFALGVEESGKVAPSLFQSEMVSRTTYQSLITIGGLVKTRDRRLEELGGRGLVVFVVILVRLPPRRHSFDLPPRHLHFALPNRFRGWHFVFWGKNPETRLETITNEP